MLCCFLAAWAEQLRQHVALLSPPSAPQGILNCRGTRTTDSVYRPHYSHTVTKYHCVPFLLSVHTYHVKARREKWTLSHFRGAVEDCYQIMRESIVFIAQWHMLKIQSSWTWPNVLVVYCWVTNYQQYRGSRQHFITSHFLRSEACAQLSWVTCSGCIQGLGCIPLWRLKLGVGGVLLQAPADGGKNSGPAVPIWVPPPCPKSHMEATLRFYRLSSVPRQHGHLFLQASPTWSLISSSP